MLTVLTNIRSTKVLWLVENDLRWKITFSGQGPSVEDNHRWKATFGGRQPLVEDNLWRKTTFCGRPPLMGDDLLWKTTFRGRGPAVVTPPLHSHSTTESKPILLFQPKIEFDKIYVALCMHTYAEKTNKTL